MIMKGQRQVPSQIRQEDIPDLESMVIVDPGEATEGNSLQSEFECLDEKYLHARLQFALKVWPYIEESLFESAWSNIRSICYGILCQVLKIDVRDYKPSLQARVKQAFFPLLSRLLSSKESESKAGGLNILGSFSGLGHDF